MPLHSLRVHPFAADYHQHHHAHHQIVIGIRGQARMDIGALSACLSAHTGCILPAGTPHGFQGIGDNQLLIVDIPADVTALQSSSNEQIDLFDQPRIFSVDAGLAHYVAFLCHDLEQHRHMLSSVLLATLLSALASRLAIPASIHRLDVARLNAFIDAHIDQPIRVAQLASLFHLSAAHFTALFRQQCHTSPYRYVQGRRMQEAWRLVHETRLPLDHIAAHTCFADQSALTHAFRRHFNLTPRALRNGVRTTPTEGIENTASIS